MPKISKEEIIKAVERYKRGETSQKAEAKKQGESHQLDGCSEQATGRGLFLFVLMGLTQPFNKLLFSGFASKFPVIANQCA